MCVCVCVCTQECVFEAVCESVRMCMGELAAGAAKESHSLLCHLDGFPKLKQEHSRERKREKTHEVQKCT